MEVDFQACINRVLAKQRKSQADVCKDSGITTAAMSKYATGKSKPTLETAMAIAKALGITLDELVGWEPKTLTEQEKELIEMFRELSEAERQDVFDYAEFKHAKKFLRERSSKEAGQNYSGA